MFKNPLEESEVTDLFLFKNEVCDWCWNPAASRVSPQPPQWGWRKFSVNWLHANSIWIWVSLLKVWGKWTLPTCEHQLSFHLGKKIPNTISAAENGIKRNGNLNVLLNTSPSFNSSCSSVQLNHSEFVTIHIAPLVLHAPEASNSVM